MFIIGITGVKGSTNIETISVFNKKVDNKLPYFNIFEQIEKSKRVKKKHKNTHKKSKVVKRKHLDVEKSNIDYKNIQEDYKMSQDSKANVNTYSNAEQTYIQNSNNDINSNNSISSDTSSSSVSSSAANEIASAESSNSYTAENGQYYGKYQLDKSYLNGDYSPENQDRTFAKYVNDRYGSMDNALAFRKTHNWY